MAHEELSEDEIIEILDEYLEIEFSFVKTEIPAQTLILLPRETQNFILSLVKRVASTNIELAYQFACNSAHAMQAMDLHMVEAWAMTATDNYDRKGLFPAMSVIRNLESFVQKANEQACGAAFEEVSGIMLPFLQGLSGRKLKLESGSEAYTDTETVFVPPIIAQLPEQADNFLFYKATIAHHWAQVQFGTFSVNLKRLLGKSSRPEQTLIKFSILETLRLDACIKRELPGLYRDMQSLRKKLFQDEYSDECRIIMETLASPTANVHTTLGLLDMISLKNCPASASYQGIIKPDAVSEIMSKRISRERAYFRVALAEIADEINKTDPEENDKPDIFTIPQTKKETDAQGNVEIELQLDGKPVAPPDNVKELITSIIVDFGDIPPEYLHAAGPGEYDLSKYEDKQLSPDDVWKGTYHEEGAEIYNEWNFTRQHYHKNWCVLREIDVAPVYDNFVTDTLIKYKTLLKSLRHTFEILRGEDKLLKKQPYGDNIDIDAYVDACADMKSGMEMSEKLFTKMHKVERDVAVIFMVDMSGSTKGWINDAERESLVLLCEVLEILGDRYAIYGFSGMTRKRCDLFKIKSFDEDYDNEVKARISNIKPHDYTRMGVFIRHMIRSFNKIEASTKLLITLSDGKPDDYDKYRGEYGVEDTRQALFEARREGIHSFCITIDVEARDYLPHMYGAANYTVIDDVSKLPLKVSDIYRRITT